MASKSRSIGSARSADEGAARLQTNAEAHEATSNIDFMVVKKAIDDLTVYSSSTATNLSFGDKSTWPCNPREFELLTASTASPSFKTTTPPLNLS